MNSALTATNIPDKTKSLEPVIEINDLRKGFGTQEVLKDVSLLLALSAMQLWLLFSFSVASALPEQNDPFAAKRHVMIERDIKGRNIKDPAVLKAMEKIPRHLFVDKQLQDQAYEDYPLPIGAEQTISQLYIGLGPSIQDIDFKGSQAQRKEI